MAVNIPLALAHDRQVTMSQSKTDQESRSSQSWQLTLEDAGDGSDDAILVLPDDLLEQTDWREGDVLNLSTLDDGSILMVKKS